jgi:formate hydrogenlyase transcriptional activator
MGLSSISNINLPVELFKVKSNISLIFQEVPLGISILDRDLKYLYVNEQMALINCQPVEQHLGKTIHEINPRVALVLEPLIKSVIADNKSVLEVETEVLISSSLDASETNFFRASCCPIKSESGNVQCVLAFVRDISNYKLRNEAQDELLKFEALLSELSAAFINIPVDEVDRKIEQGLQKIVEFMSFDRCTLWQISPVDGSHIQTHSYAVPGIPHPPKIVTDQAPLWHEIGQRKEIFRVSDVDELPDEFWREKKFCKELGGIKSFLFIPLSVGGAVVRILSLASYRVKRTWPDQLIQRLRLFWEIFVNALERKRSDQAIQDALAEIKALKDRLEAENHYLRDQIYTDFKQNEIIGQSLAIRKVLQQVEQVAKTDSTVLLLGETGTGKELLARAIHESSGRKARSMIKLNCAALPASLIEAELFGHEKGAFTGAVSTQIGRFESADGSTIFLDEIGELPLEMQSKLLRVLQESQFERLGSSKPIKVNVRVIAATNRNLAQDVSDGRFRADLYYRLNVFPISVPALRERREDIPELVRAIVQEFGVIFGKTIDRIPKKNMDVLRNYHWPGNIRELRNVIERSMILSNGSTLLIDLPDHSDARPKLDMSFEEMERNHIISILDSTGWRVRGDQGAAEKLRLKPSTLESKMKKLNIKRKLSH